jgi:hypothetical protein
VYGEVCHMPERKKAWHIFPLLSEMERQIVTKPMTTIKEHIFSHLYIWNLIMLIVK